jgi:antitoxin MazE
MARRNPDGSHSHSRTAQGRKHTRLGKPNSEGTLPPGDEQLVKTEDVVDERHVHDVTTGQRRVVVLPADLCRRLSISEGTPLRLVEHESHFEVIPMRLVPATESTSYALDVLLAGVTPENVHAEFDTGPAVGQESW